MTKVPMLRTEAVAPETDRRAIAVRFLVAIVISLGVTGISNAQSSPIHYRHSGDMPPGAIGQAQLLRGGPLPGYFQPVEISAPPGAKISLATQGTFDPLQPAPRKAAVLIGSVYRLKVTHIPYHPGVEVFPTIELIDRLYPPLGQEANFPIPVQLTQRELVAASKGRMITRVIYLEDPERAMPVRQLKNEQAWFEARAGDDPLEIADILGRPVAILRMGGRLPDSNGPDAMFLYGCPPWMPLFDPPSTDQESIPAPNAAHATPQEVLR